MPDNVDTDLRATRVAAIVGPYTSGKTSLFESLLFVSGGITRKGAAADRSRLGDAQPEAKSREMSVEAVAVTTTFLDETWSLLDCPGAVEFLQDTHHALMVADIALVVCDPDPARAVMVAPFLKFLDDHDIPHLVFVNRMEHVKANLGEILESLQAVSERTLVMTEPKRGCWGPKCDGEVCRILHEPNIAPPHHWPAIYWYLQKHVDALVTMGADGPLEYLPGKQAGLSERCFPNISLGNLPVIYPCAMNNTGEGMIAKRRGRAVLVDHLSAPVAKAGDLGRRLDNLEELHRQYMHVAKPGEVRRRELGEALRAELAAMRRRTLTVRQHTLGLAPDEATADLYLAEVRGVENRDIDVTQFKDGLARCDREAGAVLHALAGRFVPPGPSGHLSRGKVDVLPTGRNFYGIDLSLLLTQAAFAVGARMGEKLLNAYLADEGDFPKTIGITLCSSYAFQSDGELAGQILWLMGCVPKYDGGGKVKGVVVTPLDEVTLTLADGSSRRRPRIDVVVQMSSIVRDLDEPEDRNFVCAHVRARMAELKAALKDVADDKLKRLASYRCFSASNGSYGAGVGLALDASAWEDDADLAEILVNWTGHTYGADGKAATLPAATMLSEYAGLVKRMDVSHKRAASAEGDLLAYGCYVGTQGGSAAAKRGLGGGSMRLYWGDTQTTAEGEVRSVKEELSLSLATSLLNTDWFAETKTQGYAGANAVSGRTNHLLAWSATTRQVDKG